MILHIWEKFWLIPPTSIHKPDHRPALPKLSLILLFLLLQPHSAPRSSLSAPWAPDERLREMAVSTGNIRTGTSAVQPVSTHASPKGPRLSPGPRDGKSVGWNGSHQPGRAYTHQILHPSSHGMLNLRFARCNCPLWTSAFSTFSLCKL